MPRRNNNSKVTQTNKQTKKGKGRFNPKSAGKDREITQQDVERSNNDPAWYASDPAILRDAASFPFSWPTGATKTHDLTLYNATLQRAPYSDVPGICSLRTVPSIGFNLRATDPINVAAQSIYSFVRHANSGHSNYDAPDLMLYILGMGANYSYLVWCQRLYAYSLSYDQRNRYLPDQLIKANNVDPDDLRNNLANFRFWINTLIAKMSSFAVPDTLSVFSRMTFMYRDYYIEGPSIKEQLYQFVPDGFHKFVIDSSGKGKLQYVPLDRSSLMSVDDIIQYGNALFGSIWEQEDFGIMSGDILKSYGNRIIKLASIPEAFRIVPQPDYMVLTQIKNALLLDAVGADIGQSDTGLIVSTLTPRTYSTSDKVFGMDTSLTETVAGYLNAARMMMLKDVKALTVDMDDPNPDVIMEASRLFYGYDAYLGELRTGTEYIKSIILNGAVDETIEINQLQYVSLGNGQSIKAEHKALAVAKHFHYLPRIFFYNFTAANDAAIEEYFDLDNFAILDNSDIAKLHTAAVINMYAVPSIGKVQ